MKRKPLKMQLSKRAFGLKLALGLDAKKQGSHLVIKTPGNLEFCLEPLPPPSQEYLIAVHFNVALDVIGFQDLYAEDLYQPSEIFRKAIDENTAFMLLFHNEPSRKHREHDPETAKPLYFAARIHGVDLLDHLIVSGNQFKSLRDAYPSVFCDAMIGLN